MNIRLFVLISFMSLFALAACDRSVTESDEPVSAASSESEIQLSDHDAADSHASGLVLVTGATGTQGGAVARELLSRGYQVRGLTRDPQSERSQALAEQGAEMVRGDYDDPASVAAAMKGVDAVFAVTLFWHGGYEAEVGQGRMLIDTAAREGVDHFVLTSVASADAGTGIPHFESKWEVEQHLHGSELNWTVIRPVEFMDNWLWSLEEFRAGKLVDPRHPESTHQWIAASDIGFFVAEAIDNPDDWAGETLEIAGDELSLAELRVALAEAFGQEFEYVQPGWEEVEAELGEEITEMIRWFETDGYSVDVEALRARHPDMVAVSGYLSELAGSD